MMKEEGSPHQARSTAVRKFIISLLHEVNILLTHSAISNNLLSPFIVETRSMYDISSYTDLGFNDYDNNCEAMHTLINLWPHSQN